MAKQFNYYIDTNALETLAVTVTHNLGSTPIINMTSVNTVSDDETYLSIYNPIIVSVEVVDPNNTLVTFSGAFTGWFRAIAGDLNDSQMEFINIKNDVNFIFKQLDLRATGSRLTQLGELFTVQMQGIQSQLAAMTVQLTTLTNRVNNL